MNPERIVRCLDRHLRKPTRLTLTKMMRIAPQDREDLTFLANQAKLDRAQLDLLAGAAVIPDIAEIHEAFRTNLDWLREALG